MDRRNFLRSLVALAGTGVAAEFDLERLLWVPGARTIFLPSPGPTLSLPERRVPRYVRTASGFFKLASGESHALLYPPDDLAPGDLVTIAPGRDSAGRRFVLGYPVTAD